MPPRTVRPGCRLFRSCLLASVLLGAGASLTPARGNPQPPETSLSRKEAFMLMFGKGNGAMRTLCALERDGVLSVAQRRHYADALLPVLTEPADGADARRDLRIGMAFADGRSSLCSEGIFGPEKGAP